jgi:uncharacterized protein (TIGR03437 family)
MVGSVLHLRPAAPSLTLDGIANAFSGNPSAVVGGGLFAITGTGFQPPVMDLGLNPSQDLPITLGGIRVEFDGASAPILRISPGQVIVAAPWSLPAIPHWGDATMRRYGSEPVFTSVQLFYNGVASNAVWMPVSAQSVGLLSRDFPSLQAHADFPDGMVCNADGSLNDADHTAALGSTVTFFVTGTGGAPWALSPGTVMPSAAVVTVPSEYSSWAYLAGADILRYPPEVFSTVPGFVAAVEQVPIQVPKAFPNQGTAVGNGVVRVLFDLSTYPPSVEGITPPPSSVVGVYVQ